MGISRLLEPFETAWVAAGFRRLLPNGPWVEDHLRGVVGDALDNPGSLVRAQLGYAISRGRGVAPESARRLGVAVEYFHTASLLFDDLPSMDDAAERRGRPCPHRVHGEAAAILGALALINRGYALLWEVIGPLPQKLQRRAADLVESCLGLEGVLNGQARDLHFDPARHGADEVRRVAEGKTVALIRLTLLLPAVVAGAEGEELDRLERLAQVWGLAYQTLDDFKDLLASDEETGKSTGRDGELGRPNLPVAIGLEAATAELDALLAEGRELVAALGENDRACLIQLRTLLDGERSKLEGRLPVAACA